MRRILIIQGHPHADSLCAALAQRYREQAEAAGAHVQTLDLGTLQFDPILRAGYRGEQALEPDLQAAQQAIRNAEHLVFVYPVWWGAMPALLKGFLDRVFLPGFAFKYRRDSVWWDRLLSGRSARLLVTMDTPPWYYRWIYRQPAHNQMKRTVLEFCGVRPVHIHSFGPVRQSTDAKRQAWLQQVAQLAQRDARA